MHKWFNTDIGKHIIDCLASMHTKYDTVCIYQSEEGDSKEKILEGTKNSSI